MTHHWLGDNHSKDTNNRAMSSASSTLGCGGSSVAQVSTVLLHGVPIVSLLMNDQERLCLAQISNTLLREYSYNEIHNRRVALGITCVQCTPVQLEILRRAGAMPVSSRRCGMITRREAERLVKSFLEDANPPKLPDDFAFEVEHSCGWGCRGAFVPSRYNSSRAKCIRCSYCDAHFSPNKFIFHYHRSSSGDATAVYSHPDAANFNSWRRHLKLVPGTLPSDALLHAWEDVKAMFNGGNRRRVQQHQQQNHLTHPLRQHHGSASQRTGLSEQRREQITRTPTTVSGNKNTNNNSIATKSNSSDLDLGIDIGSKRRSHRCTIERLASPTSRACSKTDVDSGCGRIALGNLETSGVAVRRFETGGGGVGFVQRSTWKESVGGNVDAAIRHPASLSQIGNLPQAVPPPPFFLSPAAGHRCQLPKLFCCFPPVAAFPTASQDTDLSSKTVTELSRHGYNAVLFQSSPSTRVGMQSAFGAVLSTTKYAHPDVADMASPPLIRPEPVKAVPPPPAAFSLYPACCGSKLSAADDLYRSPASMDTGEQRLEPEIDENEDRGGCGPPSIHSDGSSCRIDVDTVDDDNACGTGTADDPNVVDAGITGPRVDGKMSQTYETTSSGGRSCCKRPNDDDDDGCDQEGDVSRARLETLLKLEVHARHMLEINYRELKDKLVSEAEFERKQRQDLERQLQLIRGSMFIELDKERNYRSILERQLKVSQQSIYGLQSNNLHVPSSTGNGTRLWQPMASFDTDASLATIERSDTTSVAIK